MINNLLLILLEDGRLTTPLRSALFQDIATRVMGVDISWQLAVGSWQLAVDVLRQMTGY
jgi:hypothetical protein